MEEGLDTGPVAAQVIEQIRKDDTAGTLANRLGSIGAQLLLETLVKVGNGSVVLHEQDHQAASIAPLLAKSDGYLDFLKTAPNVSALARGVDPWPGAAFQLNGVKVKAFNPVCVTGAGKPGEVLGMNSHGIIVACGDGAVAFAELQIAGHKRMSAKALLIGYPIPPGTILNSA
jgi:methionyl-tRNA formyltransferase